MEGTGGSQRISKGSRGLETERGRGEREGRERGAEGRREEERKVGTWKMEFWNVAGK